MVYYIFLLLDVSCAHFMNPTKQIFDNPQIGVVYIQTIPNRAIRGQANPKNK